MFKNAHLGHKIKVYVDGGADFTGIYQGGFGPPGEGTVRIILASNGRDILIRDSAVVAVVEL